MSLLAEKIGADHTRLIMQRPRQDFTFFVSETALPELTGCEERLQVNEYLKTLIASLRFHRTCS